MTHTANFFAVATRLAFVAGWLCGTLVTAVVFLLIYWLAL